MVLLASDTLIKKIPAIFGPILSRIQRFPLPISHNDNFDEKVREVRSSIKFQLKKVLTMATAVGHVEFNVEQLRANINIAINFLVSLLKKGWQNVKTIHIKTTQGKSRKIYG